MTVFRERITPKRRRALARHQKLPLNMICEICGAIIKVQIFKNEGICSTLCKKERDDDHLPASGTLNAQGNLQQYRGKKAKMTPSQKNVDFQLGS